MSSNPRTSPRRNASMLAAVLGGTALFAAVVRVPVLTPDVWWHLATGRHILASGLPHQDPFSYTLAGRDWTAHEWLADVAMYALEARTGLPGIVWARAVLLVLAFAAAYRYARLRGSRPVSLALVALAAYASQRNWIDRPQLCSFVLLPVVLAWLERQRQGVRRPALWLPPLVFLLWVNLHGGFLLGLGLLVAALAARLVSRDEPRRRRQLAIAVALSAVATLANPNGLGGAIYPLRYVASGLRATIAEEQAGRLDSPYALVHLGLLAAVAAALVLRWRRVPLEQRLAATALAWISMPRLGGFELPFAAERHAPLFLVGAVPILAQVASDALGTRWSRFAAACARAARGAPAWTAACVLTAYGVWEAVRHLPRDPHPVLPGRFPQAATRWLAEVQLPGNLVNPYRWGGYLLFHLWPEYRVWIDSRGDLYGAARLHEEEILHRLPPGSEAQAQAILDRYDANVVVWSLLTLDFGPLGLHPFTRWLLEQPQWRLVYYDGPDASRPKAPWATTAVFLREDARNAPWLERLPRVEPPAGLPR